MDACMPGFHVHHYFLEFVQTHVHWVGYAIQPSHPLSPPSSLALNLFLEFLAFSMIQQTLAIWSLVLLPFLSPTCSSEHLNMLLTLKCVEHCFLIKPTLLFNVQFLQQGKPLSDIWNPVFLNLFKNFPCRSFLIKGVPIVLKSASYRQLRTSFLLSGNNMI